MPQFRLPVSGFFVKTIGSVMNAPASCGQQCRMGNSRSEKLSLRMTSLHGPSGDRLWKEPGHVGELGQQFELVDQALRHAQFEHLDNPVGVLLNRIDLQRYLHAARRGEGVDQNGNLRALGLLEQQRGAAGLHRAVGELGDFQVRIHLEGNALKLLLFFESLDKGAQIGVGHWEWVTSAIYYDEGFASSIAGVSMFQRVALVTGASRGIGRAIAHTLCKANFAIIVASPEIENNEKVAGEICACGGECMTLDFNVTSPESVKAGVASAIEKFHRIDVLVNNAGITRDALAMRMKPADWNLVLQVNLTGAFLVSQAVIPHMIRERWGRIINIASVVGEMGNPGQANYVASKAGLIGLTKCLALELASRSVTVNAIAPGFIETDMTAVLTDEQKQKMLEHIAAEAPRQARRHRRRREVPGERRCQLHYRACAEGERRDVHVGWLRRRHAGVSAAAVPTARRTVIVAWMFRHGSAGDSLRMQQTKRAGECSC
jgi:3-oxoacyl-[acyl-carrier protein] reductase